MKRTATLLTVIMLSLSMTGFSADRVLTKTGVRLLQSEVPWTSCDALPASTMPQPLMLTTRPFTLSQRNRLLHPDAC